MNYWLWLQVATHCATERHIIKQIKNDQSASSNCMHFHCVFLNCSMVGVAARAWRKCPNNVLIGRCQFKIYSHCFSGTHLYFIPWKMCSIHMNSMNRYWYFLKSLGNLKLISTNVSRYLSHEYILLLRFQIDFWFHFNYGSLKTQYINIINSCIYIYSNVDTWHKRDFY